MHSRTALYTALLAATLALGAAATGEAQLLPAGEFSARDGRPGNGLKWTVTDAQGARLAQQINTIAAKTPIVIDYEHQTMLAERNGQPAPAAGWIHSVEWRPGAGLFARVEWTDRAKSHIAAGEYRYISPVIAYDKGGVITGVLNAALVNYPALVGMEPVVAQLRAANQGEPGSNPQPSQEQRPMDLLAALVALFALPQTTNPEQLLAHITSLRAGAETSAQALASLRAKLGVDEKADLSAIAAQVETLKAMSLKPDAATAGLITSLQGELAALRAQINDGELNTLVDGAIAAGKFPPAQRENLITLGKRDLAWLKTFVAGSPVITAALGATQTQGDPNKANEGALTDQQLAVCKAMDMTPEQFKAGAVTTAA